MQKIKPKKIHIISIGGSIMHDLAINLKLNGNFITGSDDKIYDPARKNLRIHNILPEKLGYYKNNIKNNLDFVIIGMHTKNNNKIKCAPRKSRRVGFPRNGRFTLKVIMKIFGDW